MNNLVASHYNELFDANPHPMLVYDPATLNIRLVNEAAVRVYGYSREEFARLTIADIHPREDIPALRRDVASASGPRYAGVWRHRTRNGRIIDVEVTSNDLRIGADAHRIVLIQPVSERRRDQLAEQQKLRRITEQQRAVIALTTDPAVIGGDIEPALQRITSIAATALHAASASYWELTEDPPGLRCRVRFDVAENRFQPAGFIPAQECPAYLEAVRSGRIIDATDAHGDPRTCELAERLRARGVDASLDAAVRVRGDVVGVLCHEHTDGIRNWEADEAHFAAALADQVAQVLLNGERRRFDTLLQNVAAGVAAATGDSFFQLLVSHLAEALGARTVHVGVISGEHRDRCHTIALWRDGQVTEGMLYALSDTPCETALCHGSAVFERNLRTTFPHDTFLTEVGAEAYHGMRLESADGAPIGVLGVIYDQPLRQTPHMDALMRIFTVRAAAELERLHTEKRLQRAAQVFDNATEAIVVADAQHRILEVNPAFTAITGLDNAAVTGRALFDMLCPGDRRLCRHVQSAVERLGSWRGEVEGQRSDGESYPAWLNVSHVRRDAGDDQYVALFSDITQIRRSEAELAHLAHHDALTGLPNRLLFRTRLAHALGLAARDRRTLAVLFIDLDGFKDINDSLGHNAGDTLLVEVARRLQGQLREGDTLARLGGDEFVLLLEVLASEDDVTPAAERLISAFANPFTVNGHELYITVSVGISLYPHDGIQAALLIRNADAAMYRAKAEGKNTYRFFTAELTHRAFERVAMVNDLRGALAHGQFHLEHQPIVRLEDERLVGTEALARWHHPQRGRVPPADFIPAAESAGLLLPLDQWVLETACREGRQWVTERPGHYLSVNVAAPQIQRGDFADTVLRTLEQAGLRPEHLMLEITESFTMENPGHSIPALRRLRDAGIAIAVDDFGTGYSSLAYLKRLPITTLKLDRSFTRDIPNDANDMAIARAILALAHSMGLTVIAEGVETEGQRRFLCDEGCDYAQGYLFGYPQPAASMQASWTASASVSAE